MSVATLARKLGLALPNSSMRKMFSVMAGCESMGQGWGKETDPKEETDPTEETGLGDPSLQQKRTVEPGWSGWIGMHMGGQECTLAPPQPGRKLVLQQSQGDSPGSDHQCSPTHLA